MDEQTFQNLVTSHSVVNTLYSSFQGRYAWQKVLSENKSSHASEEKLAQSKEILKQVTGWGTQVLEERPLVAEPGVEFPERETIDQYVELLRQEIDELSGLLERKELGIPEQVAAVARYGYGREQYIRGLLYWGQKYEDTELINRCESELQQGAEELGIINAMIGELEKNAELSDNLSLSLESSIIRLPAIFRMQVHDIRILLANVYFGRPSYKNLGIPLEDGIEWSKLDIDPVQAGYWIAQGVSASEAEEWRDSGFTNPAEVGPWKYFDFDHKNAGWWAAEGIHPEAANRWNEAGFHPQDARKWIEENVIDPEEAKEKLKAASQAGNSD